MSAANVSPELGAQERQPKKRATAVLSVLILFCLPIWVRTQAGSTVRGTSSLSVPIGSPVAQCDPPTYRCARTDASVIPLGKLPNWGGLKGAGTIFTDPSFNSSYPPKYVRVTDVDSGPNTTGFTVGSGNGDDSHFNLDDTLLWLTNDGNAIFVFGLNPSTMQTGLVAALNPNNYCCNGQWSQVNRNYLYTMTSDGKLWRFDFAGLSIASPGPPPAPSQVYDFGTSCGVRGVPLLYLAGVGGGDTVFMATFGTQNSASKVAAYKSSTGTCYLYDTLAGTVTRYPGGTLIGTVSTAERYTIHGAHGYADGQWMLVTKSDSSSCRGCVTFHAWNIGTTTLNNCNSSCGDHWTETAAGWFNSIQKDGDTSPPSSAGLFRTQAKFSSTNPGDFSYLNNTPHSAATLSGTDYHATAKNDVLGTHNYPIFSSTTSAESSGAITSFASNEVIAWQQTGSPAPILRFGHTFNSSAEPGSEFQGQIAVGAVSSTGKFYAFTTDGEGTLGNADGVHSTCTPSAGNCRTDVFILNLAPPPAN